MTGCDDGTDETNVATLAWRLLWVSALSCATVKDVVMSSITNPAPSRGDDGGAGAKTHEPSSVFAVELKLVAVALRRGHDGGERRARAANQSRCDKAQHRECRGGTMCSKQATLYPRVGAMVDEWCRECTRLCSGWGGYDQGRMSVDFWAKVSEINGQHTPDAAWAYNWHNALAIEAGRHYKVGPRPVVEGGGVGTTVDGASACAVAHNAWKVVG
jgi:hypothetical protein